MKVNITTRNFKTTDAVRTQIKERLEELTKYNDQILFADVVLHKDKPPKEEKHCELKVKLKDRIITSKESSSDLARAIDLAASKVETQLYRYMDKIKSKTNSKKKSRNIKFK